MKFWRKDIIYFLFFFFIKLNNYLKLILNMRIPANISNSNMKMWKE